MRSIVPLAMLLCASNGLACDCATASLAERVESSNDVFLGEVVRHTPLVSVELRVMERFKGATSNNVAVATGQSPCDYFLRSADAQPGGKFLVFMTSGAAGNTVNRCFGTAPAAEASPELELLRNGSFR